MEMSQWNLLKNYHKLIKALKKNLNINKAWNFETTAGKNMEYAGNVGIVNNLQIELQ
jgi:hypothetical protein